MTIGPPGWAAHQMISRVDGWLVHDADEPTVIPAAAAALISRDLPPLGDGNSIADIWARMHARQRLHDRRQAALGDFDDE